MNSQTKPEKQFYIYKLISSLDNQPFYIGKGSKDRMYQHIKEAQRDNFNFRSVHCKIKSILKQGGKILYEKNLCESEEQAFEKEIELIKLYGRKDLKTGILCNLTDGGDGPINRSPETIAKIVAFHKGRKRSDESKLRMKKAQLKLANENRIKYGKGCSPETSVKMSQIRKGKPWSEQARKVTRNKPTAKPVSAYKKDNGQLVGEYNSISECAQKLNCDLTTIWKICEGNYYTRYKEKKYPLQFHKGYFFKYK